jgi:hypothetical protein
MPTALLKSYAKEAGKTIEEAEKCWEKSKTQADKIFKKKDDGYWRFVNSATRKCLKLDELKNSKSKPKK